MSRKPAEFSTHPVSYTEARDSGVFRAVGKHVVDGDTFDVLVDLGMGQYAYATIRLYGVDTPEIFGKVDPLEKERGLIARSITERHVLNKPILIRTYRDTQTFGRYVAAVTVFNEAGHPSSLSQHLIMAGVAI